MQRSDRSPLLHISGVAQYDPMQIQAELGRRWDEWELALGSTFKRWAAFDGWTAATVRCTTKDPDCAALPADRIALHDTVVPRLGAERRFPLTHSATGHGRAGYFYEPSPLPAQTGPTNLWDNHRHAFTLGYGIELRRPVQLELDSFYQLHALVLRQHRKRQAVSPHNAGHPEVTTSGFIHNTGLVATLKL